MPSASSGADPLVSVVIPFHNAGRDVASMIAYLAPIVSEDVEVILVDDASEDDTMDQLRELGKLIPSARIIAGPGQGVAKARNLALAHTRGEYVWFADSDDSWSPSILTVLVARARETEVDIVACNAQKVDAASGAVLGLIEDAPTAERIDSTEAMRRVLTGQLNGHLWNKLFRRSILGIDPFPATRAHSDLGAVLRVVARANGIAMVPQSLYTYRIRAGSILNSRGYRWADLLDCRDIAVSAAASVGIVDDDPALRVFTCTQVVLPLVHESIRRRGVVAEAELRATRDQARRLARLRDLKLLIAAGQKTTAARLLLIRSAPDAYAMIYAAYRRRRWSGLDSATAAD